MQEKEYLFQGTNIPPNNYEFFLQEVQASEDKLTKKFEKTHKSTFRYFCGSVILLFYGMALMMINKPSGTWELVDTLFLIIFIFYGYRMLLLAWDYYERGDSDHKAIWLLALSFLLSILAFASYYYQLGLYSGQTVFLFDVPMKQDDPTPLFTSIKIPQEAIIHEKLNSIYFSVVTWTTLGYGDFQPQGYGKLVASAQSVFGYLHMGGLVALFWQFLSNGKNK